MQSNQTGYHERWVEQILAAAPAAWTRCPGVLWRMARGPVNRRTLCHPLLVGRSRAADLCLPDRTVSRFHFALLQEQPGGDWLVCDQSSTNGLWLNGRRVRCATRLQSRDCLMFGRNGMMVILL